MGGSAKLLGGTGGKIGLNVEKWSFSQGLSREFFQVVPTSKNTILYTFFDHVYSPQISKCTKKSLKTVILDKFQTVPSFLSSPYIGAKFQI